MPRDFVEFPSQFNEHWASYPAVFAHYAQHYKTGAPMPAELAAKIKKSQTFNQGYDADRDFLPRPSSTCSGTRCRRARRSQDPDAFETRGAEADASASSATCRRATAPATSCTSGAAVTRPATTPISGREMLDDDAYQWFVDHGGMTRANGDRFRKMVLSRGNTEDLEKLYVDWRGAKPTGVRC